MLNLYEAMYVVEPALSEQEVEALTERLKSEIVGKGGEVLDLQHLGKKRLAYPIKNRKDAFYFLLYFGLPPSAISELRAGYRLNDSILRFLIVKKTERELQLAGEETSGHTEGEGPGGDQTAATAAEGNTRTRADNEDPAEKE